MSRLREPAVRSRIALWLVVLPEAPFFLPTLAVVGVPIVVALDALSITGDVAYALAITPTIAVYWWQVRPRVPATIRTRNVLRTGAVAQSLVAGTSILVALFAFAVLSHVTGPVVGGIGTYCLSFLVLLGVDRLLEGSRMIRTYDW